MAALSKILLGTGPDTSGSDGNYTGWQKVNSNIDTLKRSVVGDAGASEVGFDDTSVSFTATTVQDAIEGVTTANGEVNTVSNIGAGDGLYYRKDGVNFELKTLLNGTNIGFDVTSNSITINNTAPSANFPDVKKISQASYTTLTPDEVLLCDTNGIGVITVTLQAGVNGRILTIKNVGSATNIYDIIITPDAGELIEDDRTAVPGTSVAIGTGSSLRIVYYAANSTWWIT